MAEEKQSTSERSETQTSPTRGDYRVYLWWAGIAFIIFVLVYQAWQIRSLKAQMETQRQEHQKELADTRDQGDKERVIAAAEAFASGIEPLMFLRNRGGDITDETVKQVVTDLGQKSGLSLIVVVDDAGMVVATTDLANVTVGQRYAGYKGPGPHEEKNDEGKWVVQRPVSRQGNLGSVILIDR
ncbi:MAG: hypothetical protein KatS3mg015_0089 [Fimbriimonadales bacterium]|nr:MAG: hypothetical protein KatS3mg015_0089 [Fimbriimonadales bacterium]